MEETVSYSAVAFLIGAMVLTGVIVNSSGSDTYFCEYRSLVANCDRLSSTHKTCYPHNDSTKDRLVCRNSPYWQKVDNPQDYANVSFTVKYEYMYNNKTVEDIVCNRENKTVLVAVYRNATIYNPENDTTYTTRVIDGTKEVINEISVCKKVDIRVEDNTSWHGIRVGDTEFDCPFNNCCNVHDNKLSTLTVPPGERDWVTYPECRPHELEKGTCYFREILTGDESE